MKVSVVVPIYNGEADLPALIKCLEAQTYPKNLTEFILVNNNSSDRTATLLETAIKNSDINLKIQQENNIQSSYAARNQGIRAAQNNIIAFTDADCRPMPDWLAQLMRPFSNAQIGIVAGEIVALPGKTLLEKYAEFTNIMSQKHLLDHPFCPYGQTANLAIRRQALAEVGLFRPYLTTGGDADICWRILQQTKWQLEFAPPAIIRHRHRDNLKDFKSQWRRYGCSNRYLHELYGVDLMRELTAKETFYRLSRWLLKEIPKAIAQKNPIIALIKTPIDLIAFQARTKGQKEAKLPQEAHQIEWLENRLSPR
ncbi:MAG: glycosyltransferase [Gomphosphaeria aponina SAG 52.96 = DSM 107014]|uniref:Glycosyltransferase n=1 Tax=Gomphosphaeria aponina SAG 52.96 = DSM 107014 TaxID=1521640 RepID=A0A941GWY9_9CHRO|nr:glycosyltransferase [Gomphosphaeria aponina SAG 52.96 = DSM 107014]